MSDYTELIHDLRYCADRDRPDCSICGYESADKCKDRIKLDAAAAIEELQAEQKKTVTQIFCEEKMAWEGRCKDLMKYISDLQAEVDKYKTAWAVERENRLGVEEPKRGEWELIDGAEPMRWGCSRCKYMSWETSNYCPRCGAKMEVQE